MCSTAALECAGCCGRGSETGRMRCRILQRNEERNRDSQLEGRTWGEPTMKLIVMGDNWGANQPGCCGWIQGQHSKEGSRI